MLLWVFPEAFFPAGGQSSNIIWDLPELPCSPNGLVVLSTSASSLQAGLKGVEGPEGRLGPSHRGFEI